jgi:hypothetical protein
MSAQVSNEIADLGSNGCISVHDQVLQVLVDVGVMDVLVEVFGDSSQLRNETECVDDNDNVVVRAQQLVLIDDAEPVSLTNY